MTGDLLIVAGAVALAVLLLCVLEVGLRRVSTETLARWLRLDR